ncbi:MAG TPA: AIPR family protein [Candidatus Paceibacterota bacterium]|jgi:hypothetical protein|nr:AIPR family protein [Candidatus Paceibacterota bacterium]
MAKNDKIVLDKLLEERRAAVGNTLSGDDFFEIYTAEQLLKDYGLSYEEIEAGIVDGGDDGGIDSIYLFVNGDLIQEETDFSSLQKGVTIDLVILQSKTSEGFSETAMDKIARTSADLFDLAKPLSTFKKTYNARLMEVAELFRSTFDKLAGKLPELNIVYHYASKGEDVHPKVQQKAADLEALVKKHFTPVNVKADFYGAAELLEVARRAPRSTHRLVLSENPISAPRGVGFIGLARLQDFYNFISEGGKLEANIFEANVRDYQGEVEVNAEIQDTLQKPESEDFWWLNNGVTILATQVSLSSKMLTIENPEIVNGLQTSREIFEFFSAGSGDEGRNILVRVIVPTAPESRYHIIRATNSQTVIAPASLRATDAIHRQIEDYLRSYDMYYDRRKNYYKNQGKPIRSIIGIQKLAQAVASVLLQRPDTARARPSSLIKDDATYKSVFNPDYPIELYRAAVEILKATEAFLAGHADDLEAVERTDLRYYVAMLAASILAGKAKPTPEDIAALAGSGIKESVLEQAYQTARKHYSDLGGDDTVAKGPDLLSNVSTELTQGKLF